MSFGIKAVLGDLGSACACPQAGLELSAKNGREEKACAPRQNAEACLLSCSGRQDAERSRRQEKSTGTEVSVPYLA